MEDIVDKTVQSTKGAFKFCFFVLKSEWFFKVQALKSSHVSPYRTVFESCQPLSGVYLYHLEWGLT